MAGTGAKTGTLYLVATPIGNLEDVSRRALRVLGECALVAAEDTRRTRKLLAHYGISRPLVSCYEQNEERRIPEILAALREGRDVALVSDAGSPGISDPGYRLVRAAIEAGLPISAVPGPSALILALSLSGLPSDRFTFYGFLPRGVGDRRRVLEEAARVPHTLVFYESPHRVLKSLEQMLDVLGDRRAAVCRELTKRFEEIRRGPLSELIAGIRERAPRGEYCLVVEGAGKAEDARDREEKLREAREALARLGGRSLRDAAREVADRYGLPRREVYRIALQLRGGEPPEEEEQE